MPLSNTQIDEIAGPADYFDRRVFARAIESAATALLLAQIAELEAQLAAAKKDAERYRWLRSVPNGFKAQRIVNDTPEGMDAAIDAAIAHEQPSIQPAQQEQPRHLWDGSPWPNYVVTLEENTEVDLASGSGRTQS